MKTKFLYGLVAALSVQSLWSQVVINEAMFSTDGADTEYVELYNAGDTAVDLTGWTLKVYESDIDAPSYGNLDAETDASGFPAVSIASGEFIVIGNAETDSIFGITSDIVLANNFFENSSATVVLADSGGATVQTLFYTDGGSAGDPPVSDTANIDGVAITPDFTVGPDGSSVPAGFRLVTDGDFSDFTLLEFAPRPALSASPGATNFLNPDLIFTVVPATFSEADGAGASLGTIVINETLDVELTITVSISDGTEISGPTTVTIPAGDDFVDFELDAVNDTDPDGPQVVTVTVSATGYDDGVATLTVGDDDLLLPQIVINEMQVKGDGSNPEFVELYNNDSSSIDIAGWSVKVFASDTGRNDFGEEQGSFTIPSGSPVSLAAGEFYLAGNADFESLYGFTPDLQVEPNFSDFDVTMILFDASDNAVYTVFSTDGDTDNLPNNAGAAAVPDLTIGPDSGSPAGYILDSDGGSSASTFIFSEFPDSLATPGTTNSSLLSRLQIVSDVVLFEETAGVGAATVTITRINDTSGALTVSVSSSDTTEITFQAATVAFADGEDEKTVLLDVIGDSDMDGLQSLALTASATGFISGALEASVKDDDTPPANLVINEMIVDSVGSNDTEFLEIYNAGTTAVDLAGYSIEKWESDGTSTGPDGTPVVIPTGSPVMIAPGGFYLMATDTFQAAYPSVTVDLEIAVNTFENSSATIVLRDVNLSILHTVFATDGGAGDTANIDGTAITPDSIGNDTAFALLPDGNTSNVVAISNAVPSLEATPRASNGVASAYEVAIDSCSASGGQFLINFTATGSSDVYVSTDLESFNLATNGGGVASGTYTDTAPPAGKAFYLIQEAGSPAP